MSNERAQPLMAAPNGSSDAPSVMGIVSLVRESSLSLLLPLVPLSVILDAYGFADGVVFGVACLALLPLAGLLGELTDQVAKHTSDTLGGFLNATFGNATELIVSYFALARGLLNVVQSSLLGSILSNLLFVLGCSMIAAGVRAGPGRQTRHNLLNAQCNTELLQVAVLGFAVPSMMLSNRGAEEGEREADLALSRVVAAALLLLYVLYIIFQLFTHPELFESGPVAAATPRRRSVQDIKHRSPQPKPPPMPPPEEDEDDKAPVLPLSGAVFWLAVCTVAIAVVSELLTGAIEGAAAELELPTAFVGFVILPIVGNAAEHSTAIVMAYRQKMDVAFGVALGSSTQIALFAIPLMVLVAIPVGQPLLLSFGTFGTVVVFLAARIVSQICEDGETNWLEGAMLIVAYFVICSAYFFMPEE